MRKSKSDVYACVCVCVCACVIEEKYFYYGWCRVYISIFQLFFIESLYFAKQLFGE